MDISEFNPYKLFCVINNSSDSIIQVKNMRLRESQVIFGHAAI